MKNSPKGVLLASDETEIQVQGQTSSPASTYRERPFHTVFRWHMLSWRENLNSHFSAVQRRSSHTRKAKKTYGSVLPKMLWRTFHWGGVLNCITQKWISGSKSNCWLTEAAQQKSFLSTMCNCSAGLVITNFEIPASKFPIVMSGSKQAQPFFFHEI
jgi:hypothetical protein